MLKRPFRKPRRGGLMVAQGKAAEATALGKTILPHTPFLPSGLARQRHAKPEAKKNRLFVPVTPGGASLAQGYYLSPFQGLGLGSLRSHKRRTLLLRHGAPLTSSMARERVAPLPPAAGLSIWLFDFKIRQPRSWILQRVHAVNMLVAHQLVPQIMPINNPTLR